MPSFVEDITISHLYSIIVVFLRVGSMLMTIPGIGEAYVAVRIRLLLAFALSMVIVLRVYLFIPPMPKEVSDLFYIIFLEIITGIFYGIIIRIFINVMQTAGLFIASQSGLSSALFFDPNQGEQGAIVGTLYTSMSLTLFFTTNMHYYLIQGIIESFHTIPPGKFFLFEDFTGVIVKTVSESFVIAFKIASPIVVVALLVLVGAGILSRLMPGIQIFFILTPIQILISFYIILLTISATIMWYLSTMNNYLSNFFLGQ